MPKEDKQSYSLSSHSGGKRHPWAPYTRDEVEKLAKSLGDPQDPAARAVDPRIPRLLATLLRGYADSD